MARAEIRVLPSARNTIMVVDDQSTGRAILEQVVRSLDERVAVEGFAGQVDAVGWATRQVSDLVLVDYMMPDMDGIELVKRLRALPGYEHVPIVMVTVHDDRKVRYAALDAGITDFLTKPVDARECLARCRNLLTLRRQQLALEDRRRHLEQMVDDATREVREHEKYDGSGYPNGLVGEHIPLCARLVAVADVFDALTSVRPYKEAWPSERAFAYIAEQRGKHFDPGLAEAFLGLRKEALEIQNEWREPSAAPEKA